MKNLPETNAVGFLDKIATAFGKEDAPKKPAKPGAQTGTKELTPAEKETLKRKAVQFQDIVKVKPDDAESWFVLAETWMKLFRYGDALQPLREVHRLQPDHPSALYKLAECIMELGRDDEAVNLLTTAREANPGSLALKRMLAQAYTNLCVTAGKLKRYDEAEQHFKKAIELVAEFGAAHLALGKLRVNEGRYKEAVEIFKQTLKMDSNLAVDVYHNLGLAHVKLGEHKKAFKNYKQAIQAEPKAALVMMDMGDLHFKRNELEEAVDCFSKALAMSPKMTADAYFKYGTALSRLKRFVESEEPLRKAIELTPDSRQVQDALVETLFMVARRRKTQGQVSQAIDLLRQAVNINPTHSKAQFFLGGLYDLNQDGKKAITHLLLAKNFYLEEKDKEGLHRTVSALEMFYKKYNLKPENFEDIHIPVRV